MLQIIYLGKPPPVKTAHVGSPSSASSKRGQSSELTIIDLALEKHRHRLQAHRRSSIPWPAGEQLHHRLHRAAPSTPSNSCSSDQRRLLDAIETSSTTGGNLQLRHHRSRLRSSSSPPLTDSFASSNSTESKLDNTARTPTSGTLRLHRRRLQSCASSASKLSGGLKKHLSPTAASSYGGPALPTAQFLIFVGLLEEPPSSPAEDPLRSVAERPLETPLQFRKGIAAAAAKGQRHRRSPLHQRGRR